MTDALPEPLLGEWACLGIIAQEPAHGWAVVRRLKPDGDIGRVWHLSRPLTYRALDRLERRAWIEPVAREPGEGGPNRTILAATRSGRESFAGWLNTPVDHLRDLRSELLVKLVFAEQSDVAVGDMLAEQRSIVERIASSFDAGSPDVVERWRAETAAAALRFLDGYGV